MDVLIKGLELPTEGRISLSIYPNGIVVNHSTLKAEKNRTTAVEVPPHGDLIERSELIKEIEEMLSNPNIMIGIDSIMNKIKNAPTVFPASEETD